MSRTYDFTLGAAVGSSQLVQATGTRCKLQTTNFGAVRVRTNTGDYYDLLPGQGFESRDGRPFSELNVYNLSGVATSGTIFVGDDRFIDDRITGSVEVMDGERTKVQNNICYSGVTQVTGATSGPRVQIWNQAGTRNVFVFAVTVGASLADEWGLAVSTTQLPTAGPTVYSHNGVNSSTSGVLKTDNAGTALSGLRAMRAGYVSASQDRVIVLPRPILVRPSTGLHVYCNGLTTSMRAAFEFEEWPI